MIAPLVRLATGAQARWVGCLPQAERQRIYFANHTSNLDGPVIWASLPGELRRCTRPVAARDYWQATRLRRWLAGSVFRAVLIERLQVTAASNPLRDLESAMDAGDSLILFPEGRRQQDEDAGLNPFKPGIWHLTRRRPGVELVPVHLGQLNRILPKGEFLPVPLMASVTFGAPLDPPVEGEEKPAFLERARATLVALAEAS